MNKKLIPITLLMAGSLAGGYCVSESIPDKLPVEVSEISTEDKMITTKEIALPEILLEEEIGIDEAITELISVEGSVKVNKVFLTKDDKKVIISSEMYGQHEIDKERETLESQLAELEPAEIQERKDKIQEKLFYLDAIQKVLDNNRII